MGSCLSCLKDTTNKKNTSNNNASQSKSNSKNDKKEIVLSTTMNNNVAMACMVKLGPKGSKIKYKLNSNNNTYTVEGSGTVVGSCSLDCDTGYWEIHCGKNPQGIKIGVVRFNNKKPTSLEEQMDGKGDGVTPSWCFDDPTIQLKEGDVIGVCWDQTDLPMLSFCLNGNLLPTGAVTRIRPAVDICPAISLQEGSTCDIVFDGNYFLKPPPSSKFTMIVCATSLI